MATIFQKTATDNCVILNPRESLTYPFSLGQWTDLRMGMYVSLTSTTGDNTVFGGNETFNYNSGLSSVFVGLTSSGNSLPGDNGKTYIGIGPQPSSPTCAITSTRISTSDTQTNSMAIDQNGDFARGTNTTLNAYITVTPATAATNYAVFYGLRFVVGPNNQYSIWSMAGSAGVTDPTVESVRLQLTTQPNVAYQGTIYFNNGFTSTGIQIPRPDNVYLYFPFSNSRVRIHSLVVDKYG